MVNDVKIVNKIISAMDIEMRTSLSCSERCSNFISSAAQKCIVGHVPDTLLAKNLGGVNACAQDQVTFIIFACAHVHHGTGWN